MILANYFGFIGALSSDIASRIVPLGLLRHRFFSYPLL